ncbi:related to hexamer-binding protein HEXBP [Phialocephala subalpina]|uniref:Related to hexamer-binding protein HEXBP n=1 Tax=Phialocephala subalpina TaxID=576137 RepID=A0A1L7WJK4_9HELO|nr:related to hexamer-binding protein HEXBP [Phialocephala subalpina]
MSWDTAVNSGGGWDGGAVTSGGDEFGGGSTSYGGGEFGGGSASYGEPTNDYGASDQGSHGDTSGAGGGRSGGCFNCGEEGHSKVDCPNPAKPRPCFNCGEKGHNKAECTNPTVAREFTGTCRVCDQQGHRAADCPSKPPSICRNCQQEGHEAIKCENPRKINRDHIENVPGEVAWEQLRAAVADHDLDDVKAAAERYVKATPDATYLTLEKAFRNQNLGIYLIAIEKELAITFSNMDLQGNLDKKYTIQWRWSPKSARPKEAEGWPTPEENLERLTDAGEPVDRGIPKCSNCDELGHTRNKCEQDTNENSDRAEGVGHRVRDCPNPRPDKFACRNCKQSGHSSKVAFLLVYIWEFLAYHIRNAPSLALPKESSVRSVVKSATFLATAPKEEVTFAVTVERKILMKVTARMGHASRECPEPKDWSRVKCSVCEEIGHTKVRCPQAKAEAEAGNGDGGYGGGDDAGTGYGDEPSYGGSDNFGAPATTNGGYGGDEFGAAAPAVAAGGWEAPSAPTGW